MLKVTARISRSYSRMTSTLPWHRRVIAFCQSTILRGSYDAFSRSVCSIRVPKPGAPVEILHDNRKGVKHLAALWYVGDGADTLQDAVAAGGGGRHGGRRFGVRVVQRSGAASV